MTKAIVAGVFLMFNFYVYHFFATEEIRPPRASFEGFPLELGEWSCAEREPMEAKVERNLGVTDYVICTYARPEPLGVVSLYVGYHASQVRKEGGGGKETSIHPPKHCLPGSGWDIISHDLVELDLPGLPQRPALVNRLTIAKGEARQLVYYWYQSQGRVIAEDWRKVVLMSWDRARRHRTDGALVRFTIPLGRDTERAEGHFREVASLVLPLLPEYVPE
jgi:EpsI family protein